VIFLINQRGQAFSVFELLIAAIVAIAILFVLLPIISGIILPTGEPIQEIGNTISSNNNTILHTKVFSFGSNQVITASAFESKIDPCSIFFDTSDFAESRLSTDGYIDPETGNGKCNTLVTNRTNSQVRAKAIVVCAQDATTLESMLSTLNYQGEDIPSALSQEGSDFTKICAVVFKRA
jgi:hypothetical protein